MGIARMYVKKRSAYLKNLLILVTLKSLQVYNSSVINCCTRYINAF